MKTDWNPDKYLVFKNERTQPSIDLVEKIELENPKTIIDIGCGPGNSTQILVSRWPGSVVTGLDSSQAMIERAKADYPDQIWVHGNAENISTDKKYSLVFSNAALQWMGDHEKLIPKLWELVEPHGAFAVQFPNFENMPVCDAIDEVVNSSKWDPIIKKKYWNKGPYKLQSYYDLLCKYAGKIVLWETRYYHILPSMQGIVDFIHPTGLRPYLEQLDNENAVQEFEDDIVKECRKHYNEQSDGKVLFPFYRLFILAYNNRRHKNVV